MIEDYLNEDSKNRLKRINEAYDLFASHVDEEIIRYSENEETESRIRRVINDNLLVVFSFIQKGMLESQLLRNKDHGGENE